MASFTDDTKIIKTIHNINDAENFQETLEHLYDWEIENNMAFNATKFKWLQMGKNIEMQQEGI